MAGLNKIILVGNLGKDPEFKIGQTSNKPVCRFSLAVNERRGGEDQTEWFNIVCFDRTAEIVNEYLAKGRQVYIDGRIQIRKYQDQNGQERYITEVIANKITMLGKAFKSTDKLQNNDDDDSPGWGPEDFSALTDDSSHYDSSEFHPWGFRIEK